MRHPNSANYYKGRTALVTGAASGIGLATAKALLARGARVFLADIDAEAAAREASLMEGASALRIDVRDSAQVAGAIEAVRQQAGGLDLLFNFAGISVESQVNDLHMDDWQSVLSVNLMGVVYGTHFGVKAMLNRGGHIVNMASMLGLAPSPLALPYSTSKYGVVGLTRSLRIEAASLGIRASVVCPGFIDTPLIGRGILRNITAENAMSTVPFKSFPVEKSAKIILDGVARNKAVILFPGHAKLVVYASRYLPFFLQPIYRKALKRFADLKSEAPGEDPVSE